MQLEKDYRLVFIITLHSFQDAALNEECKNEYLSEREQFRTTGVAPKKIKR